ncbi:MAG: hypothetical protein K2K60_04665 [Clostridia bacterium]|nr:hypothetical protein [Clostridia bacterium]
MPQSKFQRAAFALITVIITVHAYVFFSLYVVNGSYFSGLEGSNGSVIGGINANGGVGAFGTCLPVWAIILIEFAFAYTLEMCIGQPLSFRLAKKVFNPETTHPVLFETAVICTTVGLMCPSMSLIAAVIYYPYYSGFNFITLMANWLKLICFNFPFAFFSQLFFIQPFVRTVFKLIFCRKKKSSLN